MGWQEGQKASGMREGVVVRLGQAERRQRWQMVSNLGRGN